MKYKMLLLLAICLFGCKRKMESDCGTLNCPPQRNTIFLSVVDLNGKPAKAAYIETYNTRTGNKQINLQDPPNYLGGETYKYKLFYNARDFSSSGDNVTVLLKSESGKEYKLIYLVKGGNCACEVEKLSGLSSITVE